MKKLKTTSPVAGWTLDKLVQELQHVETLNICVQTSIAAAASLDDPLRWFTLVADGADAARSAGEGDLESMLEKILTHADAKARC